HAVELRADGGGADDAVDARGGAAANQDREMLVTVHDRYSGGTSNETRFLRKPRVLIAPYNTPAPSHAPPATFAGHRRLSHRYRQMRKPSIGSTKSSGRRRSARTQ